MNQIEAIRKLYEFWVDFKTHSGMLIDETDKTKKLMFLSDGIIGLSTYDSNLDFEFGKMILETMIHIKNRTTCEFIKDEKNYKNYIISCNFLDSWIGWGTSIRGAWFDYFEGRFTPNFVLTNSGYDNDYITLDEEFMNWFIPFLKDECE